MMINVEQLTVTINEIEILKNINFKLSNFQHLGVMGENGCGKSTLMKVLINAQTHSGKVNMNGASVMYIPQNIDFFFFTTTVKDELLLAMEITKYEQLSVTQKVEMIERKLTEFNLLAEIDNQPSSLSGGSKLRLAIIIVLLQAPDLIILDETIGMNDSDNQEIMINAINQLKVQNPNISIIEITHDLSRIDDFDQLLIMKSGQILDIGLTETVIKNPQIISYLNFTDNLSFLYSNYQHFRIEER